MQIHDLNDFIGVLGGDAYIPIDNGQDTGKLSFSDIFAADSHKKLWEGTIHDENESATLSENISNFDFVDIYITGIDCKCVRIPVDAIPSPIQIMTPNYYVQDDNVGLNVFRTRITISGTTAKITNVTAYRLDAGSLPQETAVTNSPVRIIRIDGVKTPGHMKGITKIATVTLAAADWNNGSQTVTVSGITASSDVLVVPAPNDLTVAMGAGVYCSNQANGTLTFACGSTPAVDITMNIMFIG